MVLDPIDETDESTTSSEVKVNQLIQQIQQELEGEDKRHYNTLAYYKSRIQEEDKKHSKQHRLLEAKLLQAIAQAEGSTADSDYWLNNRVTPVTVKPIKPKTEEKVLIRYRVKQAFVKSQKKKQGVMSSGEWNTLDQQAPIQCVREKSKKAFEAPTVKFQFERQQTKTVLIKETKNEQGVPTGAATETSACIHD